MHEEIRKHIAVLNAVWQQLHRLGYRLMLVLLLAFLLYSAIGLLAAMTSAYAIAPAQLSARSWNGGPPRKRHTPTPIPTLSVVPSSTASVTPAPAPSPTFAATPTMSATRPAQATPSIGATVSSMAGKVVGSPGTTPAVVPPAGSSGDASVPGKGADVLLPLTLGIAVCILLVAIGLALRTGSLTAKRRKLSPSGAAPWQRVRPADLDTEASSTRSAEEPGTMIEALPQVMGKSIPSRTRAWLSITSHPVPKRRSPTHTGHFLRPTRLNALSPNNRPPVTGERLSPLPGQNNRPGATIRERAREREKANTKQVPSLPGHP